MYGGKLPAAGAGLGLGGLAATGFSAGLYIALAIALVVAGGLLLRLAVIKRSSDS